jgi:hypothetical protein
MSSTMGPQYYNVFQAVWDAAAIFWEYSSARTRDNLVISFKEAFNGLKPYSWQLDVTKAILLGLNCIAITSIGSSKTMPFVMPLLVIR